MRVGLLMLLGLSVWHVLAVFQKSVEHARCTLADCSTVDVSLIEPLEMERHLHRLLRHLAQLTVIPSASRHLCSEATIITLLKVLYPSSQRIWMSSAFTRLPASGWFVSLWL